MKKFRSIVALLLCSLLLIGCGDTVQPTDPSTVPQTDPGPTGPVLPDELTYSVQVLDAAGEPVTSGVVVNFMSGDTVAAMQIVDGNGTASKVLPTGTYTVELGFTDSSLSYHYDTSDLKLSPEKTALVITLAQEPEKETNVITSTDPVTGAVVETTVVIYHVTTGYTYVELSEGGRTHFYFAPVKDGVYEFSVVGGEASIGYYGGSHFIQSQNLAEMTEEGTFTLDISAGMIGNVLVVGIDSASAQGCYLHIERIADHQLTVEELPWDVYGTTADLSDFVLPDSVLMQEFDLTAATGTYNLVLGSDGIYHLGDAAGPVVYAKLGCPSAYLDPIETILETSPICRYFYDESGNFLRKESYTEALMEYIQVMDEVSGLYPLTEDLVYIFKQRGDYAGWWNKDSATYLFKDANGNSIPGINPETAWLFLCCYGDVLCENGHTEVTDASVAPTCTENGMSEGKHCAACGTVIQAQETIAATGHSYGQWKETKTPTTDSEGEAERICSTCGHKDTKKLDKLGSTDPGSGDDPDPVPEKIVGTPANPDEPVELGGELAISFDTEVKAGQYVIHHLYRVSGTYLTIHDEYAYVVYNGTTYWPEAGTVSVYITSDGPSVPVEIWIGNYGFQDRTIHIDCLYPLGNSMNPETLTLGTFTTKVAVGEEQGYFYTFVADSSGTLTITLDSLDVDANCSITLYNLDSYAYMVMENGTVSVKVKAGQTVQIIVGVFTDDYKYPGGTVVATAILS